MNRRKISIALCILAIVGIGYWYADRLGWFDNFGPDNLPTAAERQRMREIEETSSQIAPNAVPGAGVRPQGSLPPAPIETVPVPETATTTPEVSNSTEPPVTEAPAEDIPVADAEVEENV